jgi:transketolase
MTSNILDELCVNTIRFLSIDAVEKAKSGHPGAPMGAAAMAYTLWDRFLKHSPVDPAWPDRDRFVLSCGHASMLLYSLLYLTGYDISIDDIKNFRQWGSKTPGHPEHGITPGVETTTGPLGQGFANAVGMAIAEEWMAATFNKPELDIINHYTYVMASDGDMEEGVTSEAASIAGALKLKKLICLYDDNNISIEGNTKITFAEDVGERFKAYGWQVMGPLDGLDVEKVAGAISAAKENNEGPTLIICRTVIGYGSPNKAGTASAHGEPLGAAEVELTRKNLHWDYAPLVVPGEALLHFREALTRGKLNRQKWQDKINRYRYSYPGAFQQVERILNGELPDGWDSSLKDLISKQNKPISTREASSSVLNAIALNIPNLIGGAADLAPSTRTTIKNASDFDVNKRNGRNLHFGIREHAMGSICNGIAVHGGLLPYASTFLIFYDYMRPAVRLASLMKQKVIFIFTHDSVGLGEDGPTHQPIEQLAGLRSVPGLVTLRPADIAETVEAWKVALERTGPTVLVLTRQNLPLLDRDNLPFTDVQRGAYILWESDPKPEIILIGTGSEVHIILAAGQQLAQKGVKARVISFPSWELFEAQPNEYKEMVLPPNVKTRISMEAASPFGWERYVGYKGSIIGINHFGASAPGGVIYEKFGLTPEHVVSEAERLLKK